MHRGRKAVRQPFQIRDVRPCAVFGFSAVVGAFRREDSRKPPQKRKAGFGGVGKRIAVRRQDGMRAHRPRGGFDGRGIRRSRTRRIPAGFPRGKRDEVRYRRHVRPFRNEGFFWAKVKKIAQKGAIGVNSTCEAFKEEFDILPCRIVRGFCGGRGVVQNVRIPPRCRLMDGGDVLQPQISRKHGVGQRLEILARQNRKLVFFTVKGARRYVPDADFEKLLERHFYVTELDPYQWPADYKILQTILERGTGVSRDLEGGILLPNLAPLYLSSDLRGNPETGVPPCPRPRRPLPKNFLTPRRARGG